VSRHWGGATGLMDRTGERAALDRVIETVRAGGSEVLVLSGDPGIGKTALLEYLAARADDAGCRLARAAGVQSEMELAFSGLHQLCAPMFDHADRLPGPQHEALLTALGVASGPPPDRFRVSLAVLNLLSETATEQPLICIVDDAHWLDQASAQVLGVTARRLATDSVGLIFAAREPSLELAGLPEVRVDGLGNEDARALLGVAVPGMLDEAIRDLIVAETRGNPLALLELPRSLTPVELAGGFGLPGGVPLTGRIENSFARRLGALPAQSLLLLQLAAADPSGDRLLLWRAADQLGIDILAAAPAAVESGLVEFDTRVRFRHPLVRSVAYQLAGYTERQQLHAALAQVTDPDADPDRRAWHRAAAAAGPDEDVAAELERSAGRAQARGGLAAAAAFLGRAVVLTADPGLRASRAFAAAQACLQAGVFNTASEMLAVAEALPLDDIVSARLDMLRGQMAFASGLGGRDASPLLLKAAKRFEVLDLDMARETYLNAWMAALFAGSLADSGDLLEVCRAARELPTPSQPRTVDLVLEGLSLIVTDGPAAAASSLRRAVDVFLNTDITPDEAFRWGWLAQAAASALWDDDSWRALVARQVQMARAAGAFDALPVMLGALGTAATWAGDFSTASALNAEVEAICEITGAAAAPFTAMMLSAWQGRQEVSGQLTTGTITAAEAVGQGIAVAYAHWTTSILNNGLGNYEEARAAAQRASADTYALHIAMWALPELVESASRTGNLEMARDAAERLRAFTVAGGTDFGLGILARSDALIDDKGLAEGLYLEAIERLGRTRLRPELARAHLLYGEWLRRQGRRVDARTQLHTAHDMLAEMGADAFAERASRELAATGAKARPRTVETANDLTLQEAQIVKLVGDGLTNPEIAAQMFLSPRTVEWHLRKIFSKTGVSSRRQLRQAPRLS